MVASPAFYARGGAGEGVQCCDPETAGRGPGSDEVPGGTARCRRTRFRPASPRRYGSVLPSYASSALAAPAPGTAPVPGDPWGKVLSMLKQKKASLASVLGASRVLNSTADALVVGIKGTNFQLELAEQKESRDLVEQLAAEVLGKRVPVKYQLLAEEKKTPPRGTARKSPPLKSRTHS